MKPSSLQSGFLLFLVLGISACSNDDGADSAATESVDVDSTIRTEASPGENTGNTELADLIDAFSKTYYALNPDTAVSNGLHDYDGKLPNYSKQGIQEAIDWYREIAEKIHFYFTVALTL